LHDKQDYKQVSVVLWARNPSLEEPTDIPVGFEQRITAYKHLLQDLEAKHCWLNDEITAVRKHFEPAEILLRAESDNVRSATSGQAFQNKKDLRPLPADVTDRSRELPPVTSIANIAEWG